MAANTSLVTSKLGVYHYALLINAANPDKPDRKYIWKSNAHSRFYVSNIFDKNDKGMKADKLRPLSLREITLYGFKYKKGLLKSPESSIKISAVISKMAVRKTENAKKKNAILNLIYKICDCIKNFFSGHGFKTTITLAKELSKQLSKVKPEEKEQPLTEKEDKGFAFKKVVYKKMTFEELQEKLEKESSEIPDQKKQQPKSVSKDMSPPKLTVSKSEGQLNDTEIQMPISKKIPKKTPRKKYTRRNSTAGKTNSIEAYKKNPKGCSSFFKKILFQDIKHIVPPDNLDGSPISVVGLMEECSSYNAVDLHDTTCSQILLDVILYCNKEASVQLVEWLSTESTFHPALLRKCAALFLTMDEQSKPYDPYAVERLVKIYVDNEWNLVEGGDGKAVLPVNDPILVSAMTLLLENAPNDKNTEGLTLWMMEQKEFDLKTFVEWIKVFEHKEKTKGAGLSMVYPLRDKMLAYLKEKNDWVAEVTSSEEYQDIKPYITAKI